MTWAAESGSPDLVPIPKLTYMRGSKVVLLSSYAGLANSKAESTTHPQSDSAR